MSYHLPRKTIRFLTVILSILPLLAQTPAGIQAAPPAPEEVVPSPQDAAQVAPAVRSDLAPAAPTVPVDCSATTCPIQASGFSGLDKCVERTNFCVYYTTASVTETEAEWAADQVQLYWDRYVALGFNAPKHSGKLEVYLENTGGCNGGTGWGINYMTTYAGCWDKGNDVVQMTLGHELQHRVQYNYDTSPGAPVQTKFLKEGTARAGQDNWFTNIDHMPSGAAGFTYCAEAASYLASPNTDLSSHWYKSCVWWKWAAEQYGTILTEPERGVDFFEAVYDQNTLGYSSIAAVNHALNVKAPGTSFNDSFKKFAVAAYTKDLSGLPDDSYNILDEDEPGSPGTCGSVPLSDKGAIQVGTDRQWNDQAISKYGMRYYEADVGATCPVISVSFHKDSGPAFYHIVTQDGSTFKTHKQGSGTDWSQAFLNDGVSKVVAIVGSLDTSSQVDVTLGCADPTVDIQLPNQLAPEYVGPYSAPGKFVAQVLVTDGSPTGPVVAGMTNSDFKAEVGGISALVIGGGYVQEQYFLQIQAPAQAANGPYDLEIFLEEPGTSAVLDSDTETDAVIYDSSATDHVLVIDRSGSMGWPTDNPPLAAAQDAANLFIDVMNSAEGLSVVAYNHDIDPDPVDMDFATLGHRTTAETFVNNLTAAGATSIGDGLNEAFRQRTITSTTDNERCLFTLLSDGMENSSLFWSDVSADVIATGCPVMSIAFGPYSDETLMQNIASATGGLYFYNDIFVSSPLAGATQFTADDMALDLGSIYEYAQGRGERRQRLLAEKGIVPFPVVTQTHAVSIDNSISEVLFVLDWNQYIRNGMQLKLRQPDGGVIDSSVLPYTFSDTMTSLHVGWRIPDPDPGQWEMLVTQPGTYQEPLSYQVLASGKSNLTAVLLMPNQLGVGYFTGNLLPIFAFLSSSQPILGAHVMAQVTAPNNMLANVRLFDDGEHGDGAADDGMYGGTYGPINQATPFTPTQEPGVPAPPPANDEGSYRVRLLARGADFQREALGAFSVLEGDDADGDGLPDPFEDEYGVSNPLGDPDVDLLNNSDEYAAGTDPTNSDTDGGGENDWSEVDRHGLDPLDPSDDEVEALDFFHTQPISGGHVLLTYDVKTEYEEMVLYRATSPDGPWVPQTMEPTGAFTDTTVMTGTTYYYLLLGKDDDTTPEPHWSALSSGEPVTPSLDPVPPQAFVLINGGASSTASRDVTLSFEPYEYEPGDPNGFDDITHALISNDPTFAGASWQAIDPYGTVDWQLDGIPGEVANVYVRFRDENDNESVNPEVGMILYEGIPVYLPVVLRQAS
jgi:hypothetical protein